MTIRSLNTPIQSSPASLKHAALKANALAAWNSSHGYKRGQKCRLGAKAGGRPIDATYHGIDFIGTFGLISHKVFIKLPDARSKTGHRCVAWYVPSSRFV